MTLRAAAMLRCFRHVLSHPRGGHTAAIFSPATYVSLSNSKTTLEMERNNFLHYNKGVGVTTAYGQQQQDQIPPIHFKDQRAFKGIQATKFENFHERFGSGIAKFYLPGCIAPVSKQLELPSLTGCAIFDPVQGVEILDKEPKVEITEPENEVDKSMWLTHNLLKIRRKKMNKHKLRKRRRRDAAKRRAIFMLREKKKAAKRAVRKKQLIAKIETILERHPTSDYVKRPYVIHRLKNW